MQTIDGKKMKKLMEDKKTNTIDIDSTDSFKKHHIQGSINIPHNEQDFIKKVDSNIANRSRKVVLCANQKLGTELNDLGEKLEKAGYKDVYQYKAEPSDWKSAKLNVNSFI